jgi:L-lactate dehydrogenase
MKIGIIGAGAVGAACALATLARGAAREIVLVNRTRERAKGVATDLRYGTPLLPAADIADGDYADLAGAALVMITAGVNEKTGGATDRGDPKGRLRLFEKNADAYRDIVPRIVAAAPEAVLFVVTDPPDPLADLARELARHDRVLSAGTFLDSLRFRVHLARYLGVSPATVEAEVLGEHGTSEVFHWSAARVGGIPILDAFRQRGLMRDDIRAAIEKEVRYANITIIEGIGASQYGIGLVCARIAEIVLRDERAAIPIGVYNPKYGLTLSLPAVIGRSGAVTILQPALSADETKALERGVEALKAVRAGRK